MERGEFSNICHSCRVHKSFQCLKFCICFYIWKKNLSVKINQCYFPSLIIYIAHVRLKLLTAVYRLIIWLLVICIALWTAPNACTRKVLLINWLIESSVLETTIDLLVDGFTTICHWLHLHQSVCGFVLNLSPLLEVEVDGRGRGRGCTSLHFCAHQVSFVWSHPRWMFRVAVVCRRCLHAYEKGFAFN